MRWPIQKKGERRQMSRLVLQLMGKRVHRNGIGCEEGIGPTERRRGWKTRRWCENVRRWLLSNML